MFDNYPGLINISISFTDVAGEKHCSMKQSKTALPWLFLSHTPQNALAG
jgi:hypothetical protein